VSSRRLLLRGASALALAAACASSGAQTPAYPTKPITWYVAFAPGGAGDIVARLVARKMGESMGQPVVIENRPAPMVAPVTVAKAKPDGYTLLMAGSGTALTQVLFKTIPYDLMGDFTHVSTLASFDLSLLANGQSEFNTAADVLAFARANPGKLNIGTVRIGSTQHLAAEMFKSMAGIDAVIVPYKTTAEIISALRAKDIQVAMEILPPVLGQVSSKVVKPLAITSTRRFPGLPDVPTLTESGVAGFEASSWNGMSVPAKTPKDIVDRLAREVAKAMASPDVQKELQAVGMVAKASTPEQMTQRMAGDMAKWKGVIDKANIPKQ
jgi:tripartite-type tricarboxylate transporter receptor subunit TctC